MGREPTDPKERFWFHVHVYCIWLPLFYLYAFWYGLTEEMPKRVAKKIRMWYYDSKLFQWYGDPDMVRRYNFLRKKNGSSKTHT